MEFGTSTFDRLKKGFVDPRALDLDFTKLKQTFDVLHKEFLDNSDRVSWINWGYDAGYYGENSLEERPWTVAPLFGSIEDGDNFANISNLQSYNDVTMHKNCEVLPQLAKTLYECGIRKRVGISSLAAGEEIPLHVDPDPEIPGKSIIVRGLWGLDIKEEPNKKAFISLYDPIDRVVISRQLKNNELYLFWGRNHHRVRNNLSTTRHMVCFDVEVTKNK